MLLLFASKFGLQFERQGSLVARWIPPETILAQTIKLTGEAHGVPPRERLH